MAPIPSAPPAEDAYSIFVVGASGDLAHKKTYPSLYELFMNGLLPPKTTIIGYARSAIPDAKFREALTKYIKAGTEEQKKAFLDMCIYRNGGYDDAAAFKKARAGEGDPYQSAGMVSDIIRWREH